MRIDAVGVSSSNLKETVKFYRLLGFEFPEFKDNEDHVEPVTALGGTRLMIDTVSMMRNILGEAPKPGNHSSFAILYDSPAEVDAAAAKVAAAGCKVVKEPWDAFWRQRYAIVQDPDGYRVDLFAALQQG
jgi:catechol 2,3-dioxygenase-like lactoylglutathione lyase family enzyme